MLPTIVLTATAVLVVATVLLISIGRHVRFSSRIVGILLAALVTFGSAELAARLWHLVDSYALVAAGMVLFVCALVAVLLPHWNPVGQVFLGSYVAAAGTYLALAAYLTAAGGLTPFGRAASVVLFVLELLALLVPGTSRSRAATSSAEPGPPG